MALLSQVSCKSAERQCDGGIDVRLLTDTLSGIVADYPGEIGVALIIDSSDTVTVNNDAVYPLMSVFKVHQALAVCHSFDKKGLSLDSLIAVRRDELDPATWSPMMKEHPEPVISLTVRELLRYALSWSDNNASNIMFDELVGVAQTDSFIATLTPRHSFQLLYTEAEMSSDHARGYANRTSPLGAAMLVNRLFTDSPVSSEAQRVIISALKECGTGNDRIAAPLVGIDGVEIAHKTGSGYVNEAGVLMAHNDVAYIRLPNNVCYTLAVFVKDFKGDETEASRAIARISGVVYSLLADVPCRRGSQSPKIFRTTAQRSNAPRKPHIIAGR